MTPEQVLEGTLSHPVKNEGLGNGFSGSGRPSDPNARVLVVWVEAPCGWINSNHRLHRMAQAKLTAAWRRAAAEAVPPGLVTFDRPVRIEARIWKPRAGRFDPNNLNPTTKACVDGFVDAGLFVDDSWDRVEGPDHRYGGKGPAGIIFLFTEILETTA